jgi:hypothetical protein
MYIATETTTSLRRPQEVTRPTSRHTPTMRTTRTGAAVSNRMRTTRRRWVLEVVLGRADVFLLILHARIGERAADYQRNGDDDFSSSSSGGYSADESPYSDDEDDEDEATLLRIGAVPVPPLGLDPVIVGGGHVHRRRVCMFEP